jgi:hypothetical protein
MIEADGSNEKTELPVDDVLDRRMLGEEADQDGAGKGGRIGVGFAELRAMERAYMALEPLDKDGKDRAFRWLAETLGVETLQRSVLAVEAVSPKAGNAIPTPRGGESQISPREFVSQKKPQSLVERVACLAYYLVHHRGTQHFKVADIVALNTEAAAHKFGNPSRDMDNADRQNGYIVSAGNGAKQLTVRGEAVVEALPDREAVKVALKEHAHKAKRSPNSGKKTTPRVGNEQ